MTEAEWNVCVNPQIMLDFIKRRATNRKLRLYAVACWRSSWNTSLLDEQNRLVVDLAELFADGQAPRDQLVSLRKSARQGKRVHPFRMTGLIWLLLLHHIEFRANRLTLR